MSSDIIGPATLTLTQSIGAFNTFLPPLSEIRRNDPANNPAFAADVRMGEIAAAALTIGVGAVTSSLTKSNVPILIGAMSALALVVLYESTLRRDRPLERTALALVPVEEDEG
jgi:hypothetical protein